MFDYPLYKDLEVIGSVSWVSLAAVSSDRTAEITAEERWSVSVIPTAAPARRAIPDGTA